MTPDSAKPLPDSDAPLKLSIVMPAYNEAAIMRYAVEDVQREIPRWTEDYELLVVNDGSTDDTGLILDDMALRFPRVHVLHKENGGHGSALLHGLDQARGEFIFLIDADRQIPIESFGNLWTQIDGQDHAFGVRARRHDPTHRLFLTWLIRLALRVLFRVRLRDANCPFKIFRRELWQEAAPHISADTLAPSLFLAIYVERARGGANEVEVAHRVRQAGSGSLRLGKLFRFCAKAFGQLLDFRKRILNLPKGNAQ
ncbi:MAG: glycosyltransferase family 2 protein [Candidatus Sumerlaeia bacterium]